MPIALREIAPGFLAFDCERLRAAISPETCKRNYLESRCLACKDCPTGAELAGAEHRAAGPERVGVARLVAATCIRCQRPSYRLVAACFCPSCFNRHCEVLAGRNAKGQFPVRISARLHPFVATIAAEDQDIGRAVKRRSRLLSALRIDSGAVRLEGMTTGREELERLIARLLPGGAIVELTAH